MSLKSSNKTDTNVYTLEIEIGAEPFKAAVLKAYNKAKGQIALPGFRKGKAPLNVIERFYGKDVFYEDALEIAFPEAVSELIRKRASSLLTARRMSMLSRSAKTAFSSR